MNGKPVTDEDLALWRRLRTEEGLSHQQVADHRDVHHSVWTIKKYLKDGLYNGRELADPELLAECGGDKAEYRRRRNLQYKESIATKPKQREASRNWKANNKEKTKAYDENKKWNKIWEARGAPPPRNGRPCLCEVPLLDDDSLCDWCGCFRQEAQASIAPHATPTLPGADIHWPSGVRQERERGNHLDNQAGMA